MRRRLFALVLAAVAAVAGTAAVASERDDAAAAAASQPAAPSAVTPVLSARRVPGLLAAPVADRRLVAALDGVLATQRGTTCLTVASAGRAIYVSNPDTALSPASVEKLLTATAALEVLGPDYQFHTRVVAAAPAADGVVAGDVWLVGGGDALLATAPYAARFRNQPQLRTPIEELADTIVQAGITRIDGRLLGDERRYDTDRYPDPWPGRFITQDQSGPLSALSVNDGWVAFPPNADTNVPDEEPAPDPAVHGANVLTTLLAERGVTVAGGTGSGVAPGGAVEVAVLDSAPLREVLGEMLRESDNQTAELLLKELAVARGRPGTTADGAAVVVETLAALGLPATGVEVVDGSGLAIEDHASCALIQAILDRAGTGSTIDTDLPVAGETGTLTRRFLDSPVTGRMRAKTGTLNTVTALAGYLTTTPGAELTFSFLVNLPADERVDDDDLLLQDQLAATLAQYPAGPSLEELGPQPVAAVEPPPTTENGG